MNEGSFWKSLKDDILEKWGFVDEPNITNVVFNSRNKKNIQPLAISDALSYVLAYMLLRVQNVTNRARINNFILEENLTDSQRKDLFDIIITENPKNNSKKRPANVGVNNPSRKKQKPSRTIHPTIVVDGDGDCMYASVYEALMQRRDRHPDIIRMSRIAAIQHLKDRVQYVTENISPPDRNPVYISLIEPGRGGMGEVDRIVISLPPTNTFVEAKYLFEKDFPTADQQFLKDVRNRIVKLRGLHLHIMNRMSRGNTPFGTLMEDLKKIIKEYSVLMHMPKVWATDLQVWALACALNENIYVHSYDRTVCWHFKPCTYFRNETAGFRHLYRHCSQDPPLRNGLHIYHSGNHYNGMVIGPGVERKPEKKWPPVKIPSLKPNQIIQLPQ